MSARIARKKRQNQPPARRGKLLGAYVPVILALAIKDWVSRGEKRDISQFVRQAAREKLQREGITPRKSNEMTV